jgi:hypothetical protein
MPLKAPTYITEANVDSPVVKYAWDDWGSKKAIYRREGDDQLRLAAAMISQRGRIAWVNGVTEWIVYRFQSLLTTPLPFQAIEAAWAGEVNRKYVLPFDMPEEQGWSGPVLGPIRRGLTFAGDTIDLAWHNGETTHLVVKVVNLARYVLPNTDAFEAWLEAVPERIRSLSPWDDADAIGEVVPREALDYRVPFDPARTEALVQSFLRELSPKANPFLASLETMREWGFEGQPYTWDIKRDRETRHWLRPEE